MTFVPHLLPVNRGSSPPAMREARAGHDNGGGPGGLQEAAYVGEPFIRLLPEGKVADIRNVWYSNYCDVSLHIDARAGLLVAISAIDNMVKGAAGQAIQNMNLAMGMEETAGLRLVPPAF